MQGQWTGQPVGPDVWATCRELIPPGSVFAFLAEHRDALFPAAMFTDMYPSPNGRPSMPPQILATAVLLQTLHGVSDVEAVQELRCDLRWKAACGLGLHDTAFDPSLLTYFRRRLARSTRPGRIFDAVRAIIAETGVLRGRHRRALDSAVLDDAVATQDTVTQLIAAIRRVIREVPGATDAAASCCTAHDYTSPGKPRIAWNDEQARAVLVDALVTDAIRLLSETCDQVLDARAADAIGILALVAGQDVEPAEGSDGRDGRWRIARRTAPERMVSTVDPEARHIHKTTTRTSDGFKAHLAVEPETGLLTAVQLRPGAAAAHHEAAVAPDLLACEDHRVEVAADAAYSSGPCRRALTEAGHRLLIKPAPLRPAGQTAYFTGIIDKKRATFDAATCLACPLRGRCTIARGGRVVQIRPDHDLQVAARCQAATDVVWQADYRRRRPPVERAVAWVVAGGNRRLRYIGTIKNNAWLHLRAAALNLRTLVNRGLTRSEGAWVLTAAPV
ncbi:IS1182 family transposase [Streptosporangium sp. NPDC049644]|uniref:IS1182 family transposase n=1 Tax=Streptosporangium sp. NPDC049644 TaxID=3155507 RepID=UPI0034350903